MTVDELKYEIMEEIKTIDGQIRNELQLGELADWKLIRRWDKERCDLFLVLGMINDFTRYEK